MPQINAGAFQTFSLSCDESAGWAFAGQIRQIPSRRDGRSKVRVGSLRESFADSSKFLHISGVSQGRVVRRLIFDLTNWP
ncbi:hypothetical protein B7486_18985 [cyanobacterium TDX16]|nr:hypothetical protein B7486_18985 [cyanobacterium TDX16]